MDDALLDADLIAVTANWRDRAACLGLPVDLFYGASFAEPLRVCASCPVRAECLEECLIEEQGVPFMFIVGIRGGLTAKARYRIAQSRPECRTIRPVAALCGTDSGYHRHRRTLHEEPCAACKQAHSDDFHDRMIRRRA